MWGAGGVWGTGRPLCGLEGRSGHAVSLQLQFLLDTAISKRIVGGHAPGRLLEAKQEEPTGRTGFPTALLPKTAQLPLNTFFSQLTGHGAAWEVGKARGVGLGAVQGMWG